MITDRQVRHLRKLRVAPPIFRNQLRQQSRPVRKIVGVAEPREDCRSSSLPDDIRIASAPGKPQHDQQGSLLPARVTTSHFQCNPLVAATNEVGLQRSRAAQAGGCSLHPVLHHALWSGHFSDTHPAR